MTVTIRRMQEGDIPRVGAIMVSAFNDVFRRHGYPEPFSSVEIGTSLARGYLSLEPEQCFTASQNGQDGQIVGSGFLHLRGNSAGIGPITVDPICQIKGIGRAIMQAVIDAGSQCRSLRLVQDSFNVVSFPLYTKLGFVVRGTAASLVGHEVHATRAESVEIRECTAQDIGTLAALDTELTGIERGQDFHYFLNQPPQLIGFVAGKPAGYLCCLRTGAGTFLGPAAATEQSVLRALILRAAELEQGKALRMRFPTRHAELLQELLALGFQVESLQTYMVRGPWEVPPGVDLLALFPEAL